MTSLPPDPAPATPDPEAREEARLAALHALEVLDTEAEPAFDAVARVAAAALGTPISLISLVDRDRQWFKAEVGLGAEETVRSVSFCHHAVIAGETLAVPDATRDPRFAENPLVLGAPGIRGYCGAPLRGSGGHIYGTVCVIDTVPADWGEARRTLLEDLARIATFMLESRRAHRRAVELSAAQERMRTVLEVVSDFSGIGVWEIDPGTGAVGLSPAMRVLLALPEGEVPSLADLLGVFDPETRTRVEGLIAGAAEGGAPFEIEVPFTTRAGVPRWLRALGRRAQDGDGTGRVHGAALDVTAARERQAALEEAVRLAGLRYAALEDASARVEWLAAHDPLTRLLNRRGLAERLALRLARLAPGECLALLQVDLDRFKHINDTYGHDAGDMVLREVAARLGAECRSGDLVARLGGDEFLVVAAGPAGTARFSALADRFVARLAEPIRIGQRECQAGASVGIALTTDPKADPGALMREADLALYRAKGRGRGRAQVFDAELAAELRRRGETADALACALDRGEFLPYFQIQVDARTEAVTGVEALARWSHPVRGVLAPDEFLGIARDLGLEEGIDRQVLRRALAELAVLRRDGDAPVRLAINLSAANLSGGGFIDLVNALDPAPGSLAVEVREAVLQGEIEERALWTLDALRERGIAIELDNFGSGNAALVDLLRVMPDAVKLDRALVGPVVGDAARTHLVRSIVEMVHALGIRVIAEGVETAAQAALLRELGCDLLQGYLYSQPMPIEALRSHLRAAA